MRPTVSAVRLAEAPIIDGRLDDPMWRTVAHLTEFVQQDPVEGAPASQPMDVYVGYDSQRLYFAIYAHYSDMGLMRANRVERDKTDNDDIVTISFDPFLDAQLGYSFSVNGYGVQGDSALRGNTGGGGGVVTSADATGDITWDALFTTAGQVVDDGWTAEMAIPLKSLRYPARGRRRSSPLGISDRAADPLEQRNRRLGTDIARRRRVPAPDGRARRHFESLDEPQLRDSADLHGGAAGYFEQNDRNVRHDAIRRTDFGVNLKYGFTPNLTLDFTLNPDFSQIESDREQIEVNQRFPIQYPELRPFFLEGIDTFRVQGPATFIHTRTIVDPQYAAKLTGKVGKATVGLLLANDEAPGRVDSPADPAFGKVAQTSSSAARGGISHRSNGSAVSISAREFLGSYSRFGGVDAPLQLGNNILFRPVAYFSDRRDLAGARKTGFVLNPFLVKTGRNFGMTLVSLPNLARLRDGPWLRSTDRSEEHRSHPLLQMVARELDRQLGSGIHDAAHLRLRRGSCRTPIRARSSASNSRGTSA